MEMSHIIVYLNGVRNEKKSTLLLVCREEVAITSDWSITPRVNPTWKGEEIGDKRTRREEGKCVERA